MIPYSNSNDSFWDPIDYLESSSIDPWRYDDRYSTRLYSPVESVRGRVVSLAKDRSGCTELQRLMEDKHLGVEAVDVVFNEVMEDICHVMVDPFGNYVVQKLVEKCSSVQRTNILLALTAGTGSQLVQICLNMHGYYFWFFIVSSLIFFFGIMF